MFVDCSQCRDAEGITGELMKAVKVAKLEDVPIIAQVTLVRQHYAVVLNSAPDLISLRI